MNHSTPRHDATLTGLCIHISLWALLFSLILFVGRAGLFPGRRYLNWLALGGLVGLVAALWVTRGSRAAAVRVLSILSMAGLVIGAAETYFALTQPLEIAVTRFPYPYRMHGTAPQLEPADSHLAVTTNDTGLRDTETIPPKAPNELRVVVLGGSAVLGFGSADDETAPHLLEGLLAERLRRRPVEGIDAVRVVNAGQGYYNSTQELVFFVTELALYEPDVVVVTDGYNDLHHALVWGNRPPANEVTSAMLESMMRCGGSVRRIGWLDAAYTALRASHFTSHAHDDFVSSIVAPPEFGFAIERLRGEKRNREFLPLVKHRLVMNWTLMHRLARSFGVRTLFGLQPTVFGKEVLAAEEREYLESEITDLLKESWLELEQFAHEEALRLELPLFDAELHVRSHPGRVFIDYCHMLAEGNRLWAESMAERIDDEIRDGAGFPEWDGVRFPFAEGDPLWRPARQSSVRKTRRQTVQVATAR